MWADKTEATSESPAGGASAAEGDVGRGADVKGKNRRPAGDLKAPVGGDGGL